LIFPFDSIFDYYFEFSIIGLGLTLGSLFLFQRLTASGLFIEGVTDNLSRIYNCPSILIGLISPENFELFDSINSLNLVLFIYFEISILFIYLGFTLISYLSGDSRFCHYFDSCLNSINLVSTSVLTILFNYTISQHWQYYILRGFPFWSLITFILSANMFSMFSDRTSVAFFTLSVIIVVILSSNFLKTSSTQLQSLF